MEQNPQENQRKYINTEFGDMSADVRHEIEKVREHIRILLDDVTYELGVLERYEYEKGYMNRRNAQIKNNPEWAQDSGETPFTEKDYVDLQEQVKSTEKLIQKIKNAIAEMHMYKAFFQAHTIELENLEDQFKKKLLKINPEQAQ